MIKGKKVLGLFQLVMINVIAVDSIRTLPFSAVYGFSLVFFYLLAALTFFIPTALVSAELGTGWPTRGGIYVWVREAFGKRFSFVVIWLNWIYNIIWYPTILALIAGTFTYLFNPAYAENSTYMASAVLILFWGATLINCFGMIASSILSAVGALLGTIVPMLLIICLGIVWLGTDKATQITFSWKEFFPQANSMGNLAFLTNVLFGLLGLEMAATHAAEMRNPKRDYPRSLFIACIIILGSIVFASLAIAFVVPGKDLSLVVGVMQAFSIFIDAFQLPWLKPVIALAIVIGGLAGVGAWIIGPTKGLQVASQDGSLPKFLSRTNKSGAPVPILLIQACLVSVLCLAFIFMPTVSSSFWLLSAMTAQLALLVYVALFLAALKLHHSKPHVQRSFRVPGKTPGIWVTCSLGILCCVTVILVGFLPPSQVPITNLFGYELTLIGGMLFFCIAPLFIFKSK